MPAIDDLFLRLSRSPFRQKFHLGHREYRYCLDKGEEEIVAHAADFIRERLAPAEPVNDGKQTPMRGHPVFIAQHATATCCRDCLSKWHQIPAHQPLTAAQQAWVVQAILHWLRLEMQRPQSPAPRRKKDPTKDKQLRLL